MTIIVGNNVNLGSGLNSRLTKKIKERLTISNPLIKRKVDLGLSTWGEQYDLLYYDETIDGLIIPIGAFSAILEILKESGITIRKDDIIDNRITVDGSVYKRFFSKLNFTGTLRDYQQDIITKCLGKTIGVIEAMTGSGKTIVFVALTIAKKQPTLVLVHTKELVNQTIDKFLNFTNISRKDIGIIGDGQFEIKPVSVALHQTMYRLLPEKFKQINESFGMIVADETHIIAAGKYYATMNKLRAKYKFGFSATPYRDDGLTDVIHFATGPTIHKVPMAQLKDVLIMPSYRRIDTSYYFPLIDTQEYQFMITDLSMDHDRNRLILETAKADYSDKYCCFLCSRVDQANYLAEALGNDAVALTGKTKKKERLTAMEQLVAGTKRIVSTTYKLFSLGIDIPHLEILFLCGPMRAKGQLRQVAGRIMRIAEGKVSAEIVDFVDYRIELLKYQYYARNRIFKNLRNEV